MKSQAHYQVEMAVIFSPQHFNKQYLLKVADFPSLPSLYRKKIVYNIFYC
jgi:hypothetical protein